MAFKLRDLSVLNYANGFTSWHYKMGNDTLADVNEIGFFKDAADLLAQGDMMICSAENGGQIGFVTGTGHKIRLVPTVTSGGCF